VLGLKHTDISPNVKIKKREAIRGIIFKDNKILLIKTNRGDYKFPGGGKNDNESRIETLIREVKEESGYEVKKVDRQIGVIIERRPDFIDQDAIFEMISFYYLCQVSEERKSQNLDQMEIEQEFKPEWISLDEAIYNNETLLNSRREDLNFWVERETSALKEIRKMLTEGAIKI